MRINNFIVLTIIVFCIALIFSPVLASSDTVVSLELQIREKATGVHVENVNVYLDDSLVGKTDDYGYITIPGITIESHTLKFVKNGYDEYTMSYLPSCAPGYCAVEDYRGLSVLTKSESSTPRSSSETSSSSDSSSSSGTHSSQESSSSLQDYYNQGLSLWQNSRPSDAIPLFLMAIQIDESNPSVDPYQLGSDYRMLGWSYIDNGQYDNAISPLKRAIDINANDAWAPYHLGRAYQSLKDYNNAVYYFNLGLQRAQTYYPTETSLYQTMKSARDGVVSLQQQSETTTTPSPTKVTSVQTNSPSSTKSYTTQSTTEDTQLKEYKNKGYSLYAEEKYDEAIEYYDKALSLAPNDVTSLYFKGNSLLNSKKYDETIEIMDKIISINPPSTQWENRVADAWALKGMSWGNKGTIENDLNDYESALMCYNIALEIQPNNQQSKDGKKIILKQMEIIKTSQTSSKPSSISPATGLIVARVSDEATQQNEGEPLPYEYTVNRDGHQVDITLSKLNNLLSKNEKGEMVGYYIPIKITGVQKGDQITIQYDDPIPWFGLGKPVGYVKVEIASKSTAWIPSSPKLKFTWRSKEGQQGQGISGENRIESMGANVAGYPNGADTLSINVASLGKEWLGIGDEINQGDVEIKLWVFNSQTYGIKVFTEAYEKSKGLAVISALSG